MVLTDEDGDELYAPGDSTDDDSTDSSYGDGRSGNYGDNTDNTVDFISEWGDLSLPNWLQNLEAFANSPQRTILGILISTIVAYAVWAAELSISGILAAAGFEVGFPRPDGDLPAPGSGEWWIAPKDYTGPVDVPGMVYDIFADLGGSIGQPLLTFLTEINTQMASVAGNASGVPGLVQPAIVLGMWTFEFAVVLWIASKSLSLGKTLALDTLNPL